MSLPLPDLDPLAGAFERWLGPDLYSATRVDLYRRFFERVLEASRGASPQWLSVPEELSLWSYRWASFVAVADGFARRWLGVETTPRWRQVAASTPRPTVQGLQAAAMSVAVDINSADGAALAALPGLGPITAARIVALRQRLGRITGLDDLKRVPGLSRAKREALAQHLVFDSPNPPPGLHGAASDLDFLGYVRLQQRSGLRPATSAPSTPPDPLASPSSSVSGPALATAALRRLASEVRRGPHWPRHRPMDLRDAERATEALDRASTRDATASRPHGVGLVRGSAYLELCQGLIDTAKQRVWIQMFFLSSSDGSPGDILLDALARAKNRGLDVRVILDTDLESDYHGASRVNADAVTKLESLGIATRLDTVGRTTHSKVVLVDQDRLLIGTHNWTAGSMYRQDDTSLLLEDADATEIEARRFGQLWDAYHPDPEKRAWHLPSLRFPLPHEQDAFANAAFHTSRELLEALPSHRSISKVARALDIDPDRLARLWRLLKLMHAFGFPEPTAYALTLTPVDAPSELRRTPRARTIELLAALPPLGAPYSGSPIRFDVVEAADG